MRPDSWYDELPGWRRSLVSAPSNGGVPISDSKTERLQNLVLSSSETRFTHPRTVFLERGLDLRDTGYGHQEVPGLPYNYDDRIRSWYGWGKCQDAWDELVAADMPARGTAAFFEAWLRKVTDDPGLVLKHILVGQNHSTLYSYHVYGYTETPKP